MLSRRPLVPAIAKCNAAAVKLSVAASLLWAASPALAAGQAPADWPCSGHDIHNTRNGRTWDRQNKGF